MLIHPPICPDFQDSVAKHDRVFDGFLNHGVASPRAQDTVRNVGFHSRAVNVRTIVRVENCDGLGIEGRQYAAGGGLHQVGKILGLGHRKAVRFFFGSPAIVRIHGRLLELAQRYIVSPIRSIDVSIDNA